MLAEKLRYLHETINLVHFSGYSRCRPEAEPLDLSTTFILILIQDSEIQGKSATATEDRREDADRAASRGRMVQHAVTNLPNPQRMTSLRQEELINMRDSTVAKFATVQINYVKPCTAALLPLCIISHCLPPLLHHSPKGRSNVSNMLNLQQYILQWIIATTTYSMLRERHPAADNPRTPFVPLRSQSHLPHFAGTL